jgi:hypothetical protein
MTTPDDESELRIRGRILIEDFFNNSAGERASPRCERCGGSGRIGILMLPRNRRFNASHHEWMVALGGPAVGALTAEGALRFTPCPCTATRYTAT